MPNRNSASSPWKSRIFVIAFVAVLAFIVWAFIWVVQSANSALSQEHEIINLDDVANRIDSGQVERILIQGEQDAFLYLPGHARPLYTQIEAGKTFTTSKQQLQEKREKLSKQGGSRWLYRHTKSPR